MTKADRPLTKAAYPEFIEERLRFADTDLVGHVNNAAFATLFEIGRVSFLFDPQNPLFENNDTFVLARLNIDFRGELHFPGMVSIATGVSRVGSSSATIMQALFSGETCVGTGESVVVLIDGDTRRAKPLPDHARAELTKRVLRT